MTRLTQKRIYRWCLMLAILTAFFCWYFGVLPPFIGGIATAGFLFIAYLAWATLPPE